MLDGAARLTELFAETARMGMPALAMTDHGNVFGAYDFYRKATDAGVKPIIGMEAYVTPNTHRGDRTRVRWAEGGENDVSGGGAFTHMTLLAESTQGMHNLFRLSSRSSLEGFFYKPRADRELLAEYAPRPDRDNGMPVRRDPDVAAHRRLREGARERRRVPGHLRQGQLLRRADGPRPRHREEGPDGAAAAGQGPRHAGHRDQRPALHPPRGRRRARGAAVRPVRQDHGRPETVQARRSLATTSRARPKCARCGPTSTTCARRATTRC